MRAHTPNPFPVSAVARHSPSDGADFSIATPAVRQALDHVRSFLGTSGARPDTPGSGGSGHVIAVVGEYGTGKTHLTVELLHWIEEHGEDTAHTLYVDAPSDTFQALYKDRFFPKLDKDDVRRRVTEYYADVVAEELADSPLTADAARMLKDRRLHPQEVVRRLGLSESAFLQALQARLGHITEHSDFGTALALFLRPEFEAAVWEWLAGHPADPVLKERGVERTIDTDISALEAIGVFAFLYGRQGHRFVLAVDEFEKVLSRGTRSAQHEGSVLAFKKLLEVFAQTRSLLILSGLPDFIEILPTDAQQRISCLVRPTALSAEDTRGYIRHALGRAGGPAGRHGPALGPFSEEVIAYLVELAGGNARKVIRLCYHAYQAAATAGTDISRAMVREVARDQFEASSPQDVRAEIVRVLDSGGWAFEQDHRFGTADETGDLEVPGRARAGRVDFWLPVGGEGAGLGIVLSQSVLNDEEALRVAAQGAEAAAAANGPSFVVLVVNGYLAENLSDVVTEPFERVFGYAPRRFPDDFAAAVKGLMQRLEATFNDDRIALIESRMSQLMRQTSGVRSSLDEIGNRLTSPALLERAVTRGVRRAFGAVGEGDSAAEASLPPDILMRFQQAAAELRAWREIADTVIEAAFDADDRHSSPYPPSLVSTMGLLLAQERTLNAFRDAVSRALDPVRDGGRDSHGPDIGPLCHSYDRLTGANLAALDHEALDVLFARSARSRPSLRRHRREPEAGLSLVHTLRDLGRDVYALSADYEY
ncbi:hypothetical protein [Streptomyces genisteinicus]|uniref:AAA+ ATPase domain-containing protein n=1 Tax=Streptomyces genisteinicus TaxID=2768068 RepID=A0A7H0HLR0_9ACTN|nr:hypothetical protein [Streptomyces genisteinicus]QNP61476.1 hypothetical protein IAG43_00105 [Streptomyces genisteinicus]